MDKKHNLGIYWGQKGFSLVESNKGQAIQTKYIAFNTPISTDQSEEIPEGLKYTALLQKALGEMQISPQFINLSLPNEDLIFRSFVIPWMQAKEVKNVVEFEATKYIPIKLDDLSYTYHPVTVTDNNQKNLLILFVAIRKSALEKYIGVFEHTGLKIENIEPSAVSLSRALHKYGHISRNQTNAVIELTQDTGKIVVIDKEVVQFVRNFPLQTNSSDIASINSQISSDIRVSLNFYTRQNPKAKIDKFVLVSLQEFPQLAKSLTDEFGKPVNSLTTAKVMKNKEVEEPGLINAFGVSIRDKSFSTKNFDLSEKATKCLMGGEDIQDNEPNYQKAYGVVAVCLFITLCSWFLSNHMIKDLRNQKKNLSERQGVFETSDKSSITKMQSELEKKIENYKKIRTKSNIQKILTEVPKLLPKGTWLQNFSTAYVKSTVRSGKKREEKESLELKLNGYAYLADANSQLKLVNLLVSNLKDDEYIKKEFKTIELVNVRQQKMGELLVTSYRINCAQE